MSLVNPMPSPPTPSQSPLSTAPSIGLQHYLTGYNHGMNQGYAQGQQSGLKPPPNPLQTTATTMNQGNQNTMQQGGY
jgi:hypothetical protein